MAFEKGIITNKFFVCEHLRKKELPHITEYFKIVGRQVGVRRREERRKITLDKQYK